MTENEAMLNKVRKSVWKKRKEKTTLVGSIDECSDPRPCLSVHFSITRSGKMGAWKKRADQEG